MESASQPPPGNEASTPSKCLRAEEGQTAHSRLPQERGTTPCPAMTRPVWSVTRPERSGPRAQPECRYVS